jgi:hypothetical protein
MEVQEVGYEGVDWVYLVQDRVMWRAVVTTVIKVTEFLDQLNNYKVL